MPAGISLHLLSLLLFSLYVSFFLSDGTEAMLTGTSKTNVSNSPGRAGLTLPLSPLTQNSGETWLQHWRGHYPCARSFKIWSSDPSHIMGLEEDTFLEARRYMSQKKGQPCTSRESHLFPLSCSFKLWSILFTFPASGLHFIPPSTLWQVSSLPPPTVHEPVLESRLWNAIATRLPDSLHLLECY